MQDEDLEQPEETPPAEEPKPRRRWFTRRNALLLAAGLGVLIVVLGLVSVVLFRYGTVDSIIKGQFVEKMHYMGIDFTADEFHLTLSPLELTLKNATFNDRVTGEKLGFIRDARIGLSVDNLYAWQLSRDIKVDTTEIWGAEVWVKFDENGRSNFANLVQDERESRISLKYDSVRFQLRDSVVHFGDLQRTIAADANNIQFFLDPESWEDPTTPRRYRLDLTSTESTFTYQDGKLWKLYAEIFERQQFRDRCPICFIVRVRSSDRCGNVDAFEINSLGGENVRFDPAIDVVILA